MYFPRKKYKRLKYGDRVQIEKMCQEGKTLDEMALIIGVHSTTMLREIKRGGDPYSAETAQRSLGGAV